MAGCLLACEPLCKAAIINFIFHRHFLKKFEAVSCFVIFVKIFFPGSKFPVIFMSLKYTHI